MRYWYLAHLNNVHWFVGWLEDGEKIREPLQVLDLVNDRVLIRDHWYTLNRE